MLRVPLQLFFAYCLFVFIVCLMPLQSSAVARPGPSVLRTSSCQMPLHFAGTCTKKLGNANATEGLSLSSLQAVEGQLASAEGNIRTSEVQDPARQGIGKTEGSHRVIESRKLRGQSGARSVGNM